MRLSTIMAGYLYPIRKELVHDLYLGRIALAERENVGFRLRGFCPSFVEDPPRRCSLRVGGFHILDDLMRQMAFRNFIYTKDNEDLAFLPRSFLGFLRMVPYLFRGNIEPSESNEGAQIKDRKCKTRGGSLRPLVKRKLAFGSSTSRATRAKTSSLKDDAPFLTVSDDDEAWKNHLDNHMDLKLLDLHDCCYARQAVVDNVVNRRSRELLQVIEKLRGECEVVRSRERAREEECKGLRVKCKAAMTEFEKNPIVVTLREKIFVLSAEVKEHKLNLDRMMQGLEGLNVSPKGGLGLGSLQNRWDGNFQKGFRQVVDPEEPFDLSKVRGYRSSYKKDHTQASNDLATATFP
ncbi:hypothetical protein Tco_0612646 [Tanacetum coccineum]